MIPKVYTHGVRSRVVYTAPRHRGGRMKGHGPRLPGRESRRGPLAVAIRVAGRRRPAWPRSFQVARPQPARAPPRPATDRRRRLVAASVPGTYRPTTHGRGVVWCSGTRGPLGPGPYSSVTGLAPLRRQHHAAAHGARVILCPSLGPATRRHTVQRHDPGDPVARLPTQLAVSGPADSVMTTPAIRLHGPAPG